MMKTLTSRLLFVDEDREFLQCMRKGVPGDFCVDTADSVQQAIEKLRNSDFDLCAVELNLLTSLDGYLAEWLCKNKPLTVCLPMTSSPADTAATAAEKLGAFDYLVKPISPQVLAYSIRRAVDHRKLLIAEQEARRCVEKLNRQVGDRIRRATGVLVNSNQRLSAANRAKDHFLASMSHELRTPLAAITGAVRILQSPKVGQEKAHSVLDILDRNVFTLKRLLDDLLDCSRIASGKLSLELVPTNVVDSVNAAVETMRAKASEAAVRLNVLLPAEPVMVHGNALRLQQIAWNLIDNAIKFTPQGGDVFISISCTVDDVELTVCDSGSGVSDEDKDRIFEPFTQLNGSEDQKKGGLGLGLALVRNLTQLHKGSIRVESNVSGHGSRFIVKLSRTGKASPVHQAA